MRRKDMEIEIIHGIDERQGTSPVLSAGPRGTWLRNAHHTTMVHDVLGKDVGNVEVWGTTLEAALHRVEREQSQSGSPNNSQRVRVPVVLGV